ncbi:hypothetical protein HanIR_Chr07g0330861 [Helianthus annuus]|nr:hypothetical protein HanIR_Chr07g0330861 [Helianthus annuus]
MNRCFASKPTSLVLLFLNLETNTLRTLSTVMTKTFESAPLTAKLVTIAPSFECLSPTSFDLKFSRATSVILSPSSKCRFATSTDSKLLSATFFVRTRSSKCSFITVLKSEFSKVPRALRTIKHSSSSGRDPSSSYLGISLNRLSPSLETSPSSLYRGSTCWWRTVRSSFSIRSCMNFIFSLKTKS